MKLLKRLWKEIVSGGHYERAAFSAERPSDKLPPVSLREPYAHRSPDVERIPRPTPRLEKMREGYNPEYAPGQTPSSPAGTSYFDQVLGIYYE